MYFSSFIDDNNTIVNAVIILLPIFILYKIYDDGVKNKAYGELNSFTLVTYYVCWLVLADFGYVVVFDNFGFFSMCRY